MKTELFLDVPVDVVAYDDIIDNVEKYIDNNQQMTIASVNPQIVLNGKKHPKTLSYINNATYRIPDGIGIVKASQMYGGEITDRITGIELMIKLIEKADQLGEKVFLYGAKPLVIKKTKLALSEQYPNIEIVGCVNGYTKMSNEELVKKINNSGAKFLFVALGFPKQEEWLSEFSSELNVNIIEDVGGSFDVLSGCVKRAPQWMINHNLEWLYRSFTSFKHFKRLFQLPIFVIKIWLAKPSKESNK